MAEIPRRPLVSVVMPCFNEEAFIADALNSLVDDYVRQNAEFLVPDGGSTDATRDIVNAFASTHGLPLRLLDNKMRYQVFGLNLAIAAARGEIILRADAHSLFPPGYVRECVETLQKTGAAGVGGVMRPLGKTAVQKAIALAMRHPLGVGNAKFHLGRYSGYADTVYLGTYPKAIFDEVGLFDSRCRTNEDAELNLRIRQHGKRVYLNGGLEVTYFPRKSLGALAVQYFRYGRGRAYTTVKHRQFTSVRQVAPIALVPALAGAVLLSPWKPIFLGFVAAYLLLLAGGALFLRTGESAPLKIRLLAVPAFVLMHNAWGAGFLSYLLCPGKKRGAQEEPAGAPLKKRGGREEKKS